MRLRFFCVYGLVTKHGLTYQRHRLSRHSWCQSGPAHPQPLGALTVLFWPHLCAPRCNRQMLLASCQYLYLLRHQRHGASLRTVPKPRCVNGPLCSGGYCTTSRPKDQNHQMPQARNGASNAAPFSSCLDDFKISKFYKISHHIESLNTYMKY